MTYNLKSVDEFEYNMSGAPSFAQQRVGYLVNPLSIIRSGELSNE